MDKSSICKKLDDIVENYRKDMALFPEDSTKPATIADLSRLSTMTFYAISELTETIKKTLIIFSERPQFLAAVFSYIRRK